MKITYIINDISTTGGREKITIQKAKALSELGHSVEILTHRLSKKKFGFYSDKVKIINLNIPEFNNTHIEKIFLRPFRKFIFLKRLSKSLLKFRPDVVISLGDAYSEHIKKVLNGIPLITEVHGNYENFFDFPATFKGRYRKIQPKKDGQKYPKVATWFCYQV